MIIYFFHCGLHLRFCFIGFRPDYLQTAFYLIHSWWSLLICFLQTPLRCLLWLFGLWWCFFFSRWFSIGFRFRFWWFWTLLYYFLLFLVYWGWRLPSRHTLFFPLWLLFFQLLWLLGHRETPLYRQNFIVFFFKIKKNKTKRVIVKHRFRNPLLFGSLAFEGLITLLQEAH